MIDASHYSALSFAIFMGILAYKKWFGLPQHLQSGIEEIVRSIKASEISKQKASDALMEAKEKIIRIENDITALHQQCEKDISVLIEHKTKELEVLKRMIRKKHEKTIYSLERQYQQVFGDDIVNALIARAQVLIHAHQTTADHKKQLQSALKNINFSHQQRQRLQEIA